MKTALFYLLIASLLGLSYLVLTGDRDARNCTIVPIFDSGGLLNLADGLTLSSLPSFPSFTEDNPVATGDEVLAGNIVEANGQAHGANESSSSRSDQAIETEIAKRVAEELRRREALVDNNAFLVETQNAWEEQQREATQQARTANSLLDDAIEVENLSLKRAKKSRTGNSLLDDASRTENSEEAERRRRQEIEAERERRNEQALLWARRDSILALELADSRAEAKRKSEREEKKRRERFSKKGRMKEIEYNAEEGARYIARTENDTGDLFSQGELQNFAENQLNSIWRKDQINNRENITNSELIYEENLFKRLFLEKMVKWRDYFKKEQKRLKKDYKKREKEKRKHDPNAARYN